MKFAFITGETLATKPNEFLFAVVVVLFLSISLTLAGNLGRVTWVRRSSRKSSATHSCQCVCVCVCVCAVFPCVQTMVWLQCLGFLTCAQMMMHAIAHGGCMDSVRESALKVWEKNPLPHWELEPASVFRLACQSAANPNKLSPPLEWLGTQNARHFRSRP